MNQRQFSSCLFLLAGILIPAVLTYAQTQARLTFLVKTPDGAAVPNADVSVRLAKPPQAALATIQGRRVNKYGLQAQPYQPFFVTKTNAGGQAQGPKSGLENALPNDSVLVTVRAEGYPTYRQTFELPEQKPGAEQKQIEIVLRPLPPQE